MKEYYIMSHLPATSLFAHFSNYFDYSDHRMAASIFMILICPLIWNLFARLEFSTKFFSKLVGGNVRAANIFAGVLIVMGTIRNYLFALAVDSQEKILLDHEIKQYIKIISCIVFFTGLVFVAMSYYRLGINGIYYGDYFGLVMKEKVTKFPYDVLENPLYIGSTLMFFSTALYNVSPSGLLMSILVWGMYSIASLLENPMTAAIYSPENLNQLNLENEEKRKK